MKEQLIYKYRMLFVKETGAQIIKKNMGKVKGVNGVMLDEDELWNDVSDALDYSLTPRFKQLMKRK